MKASKSNHRPDWQKAYDWNHETKWWHSYDIEKVPGLGLQKDEMSERTSEYEDRQKCEWYDEHVEKSIVSFSDAICYPRAVMVKSKI